jgi:hypothetical protein
MTTNRLPDTKRGDATPNRVAAGVLAALLVGTAGLVGHLLVNHSRVDAEAQAQLARDIARENQAVCVRLGAGPSSGRFSDCAAALNAVRDRAIERNTDPFM